MNWRLVGFLAAVAAFVALSAIADWYGQRSDADQALDELVVQVRSVPAETDPPPTGWPGVTGAPDPLYDVALAARGYLDEGAVQRRFGPDAAAFTEALGELRAALGDYDQAPVTADGTDTEAQLQTVERRLEELEDGQERIIRTRRSNPARELTVGRRFDTDARTGRGMYEAYDTEAARVVVVVAEDGAVTPGLGGSYRVTERGVEPVSVTQSDGFRAYQTTELVPVYVVLGSMAAEEDERRAVADLRREASRQRGILDRARESRRPAFEARAGAALSDLRMVIENAER